jgi:hypothetical protein
MLFSRNRSVILTTSFGSSSDTSKSGYRYAGSISLVAMIGVSIPFVLNSFTGSR